MTYEQKELLLTLGVNFDVTLERFMGNEALFIKCLKKLLADNNYSKLLNAIENSDVKTAFECSHALKGVTANLGLDDLTDEFKTIVEVFRAERMDYDPANLERLKEKYKKAIEVIEQL